MTTVCATYKCDHTFEDDGRDACAFICECGGTAVTAHGKCEGC